MATRITQWKPDTCNCVMEYSWDDAEPENTRTHSFARAVQLCDAHSARSPEDAFDQVKSENLVKNVAATEFASALPGKSFEYVFTADRKLFIKSDHLTKEEQAKLQSDVVSKFDSQQVETATKK